MFGKARQRGSILIVTTILFTVVLALVLATLVLVTDKVRDVRASANDLTAEYAADRHKTFWFERDEVENNQESRLELHYAPAGP